MSFKTAIISELNNHAGLTALIGTRVNPGRVLTGTLPYISVEITQDEPLTHFGGDAGMDEVRFRVDIYGATALSVQNVYDQVDLAIGEFTGDLGTENLNTRFIKQVDAADQYLKPEDGSQVGKQSRRVVYQAFHL